MFWGMTHSVSVQWQYSALYWCQAWVVLPVSPSASWHTHAPAPQWSTVKDDAPCTTSDIIPRPNNKQMLEVTLNRSCGYEQVCPLFNPIFTAGRLPMVNECFVSAVFRPKTWDSDYPQWQCDFWLLSWLASSRLSHDSVKSWVREWRCVLIQQLKWQTPSEWDLLPTEECCSALVTFQSLSNLAWPRHLAYTNLKSHAACPINSFIKVQ